jgi:acyl-CoA dehydrogenase
MIGRTLVGRACTGPVEKALGVMSGARTPVPRCKGARYHPLEEKAQHKYAGRVALGVDIDG